MPELQKLHAPRCPFENLPERRRGRWGVAKSLVTVSGLADEICADCVPPVYTTNLRNWMDRIHELAARVK